MFCSDPTTPKYFPPLVELPNGELKHMERQLYSVKHRKAGQLLAHIPGRLTAQLRLLSPDKVPEQEPEGPRCEKANSKEAKQASQ